MDVDNKFIDETLRVMKRRMHERFKQESIARVSASVAHALDRGASWNEVREAVAQGRVMYDPTLLEDK